MQENTGFTDLSNDPGHRKMWDHNPGILASVQPHLVSITKQHCVLWSNIKSEKHLQLWPFLWMVRIACAYIVYSPSLSPNVHGVAFSSVASSPREEEVQQQTRVCPDLLSLVSLSVRCCLRDWNIHAWCFWVLFRESLLLAISWAFKGLGEMEFQFGSKGKSADQDKTKQATEMVGTVEKITPRWEFSWTQVCFFPLIDFSLLF